MNLFFIIKFTSVRAERIALGIKHTLHFFTVDIDLVIEINLVKLKSLVCDSMTIQSNVAAHCSILL